MRSRIAGWISAAALVTTIIVPAQVAAQENNGHKRNQDRYILVDMGTFGGPGSNVSGPCCQTVNNQGRFVGFADTSIPHPFPNANDPFNGRSAFIQHAFEWKDGIKTDLGALPGGSSGTAWISNSGFIAGGSQTGVIDPLTGFLESNAVLWNKGRMVDLGNLGGAFTSAVAVNNSGELAGFGTTSIPDPFSLMGVGAQTRAFRGYGGVIQDLGTLGGLDAMALFVNEGGQIVGQSYTNSIPDPVTRIPVLHPFLWKQGKMTDLGTLGGVLAFPNALNNGGQVVGLSDLASDLIFHPFLVSDKSMTDLGTLGGNYGSATWISDAGDVVGWATPEGDQVVHAFRWRDGTMTDLGLFNGDACSVAESVNSRGQVIGVSTDCGETEHPFIWQDGGPMVDLNKAVLPGSSVTVQDVFFINERGEIAGYGFLPSGDRRAVLLIPCSVNHEWNSIEARGCNSDAENAIAGGSEATSNGIQRSLTPAMLDSLGNRFGSPYRRAVSRQRK